MTEPTRRAGRYGRRPPKNAPAIKLGPSLTGVVPVHPAAADYLAKLTNWQMLGNDQYGNCITPDTRVLTADLCWLPAGNLEVGDELLAFDEESRPAVVNGTKKPGRCYRLSVVERTDRVMRPCYELEFDDGTVVRCSAGHRWLVGSLCNGAKWAATRDLKAGSKNASSVCKPLEVWDDLRSWGSGYLAAAFDGEGNVENRLAGSHGGHRVCFSQVDNVMLAEVERILMDLGFDYRHGVQPRGGNLGKDGAIRQDIHRLSISRRSELLRFLGSVRPQRILENLDVGDLGRLQRTNVARLVRKTYIGDHEVVMLDTSSRTYFAEGLASHNCVAVTWANTRRLVTAWLSTENYPTLAQVETFYETQNPGFPAEDNGMDIQTALEDLVANGGPDGVKALGFAKVDCTNPAEIKAAIAIFGSVWTGINVLAANQTEFGNGQPWDYVVGSPVDGGHSIITGGYGTPGAGALGGDERFITWAAETSFTDSFWSHEAEEAWVVIWPEMLTDPDFLAGVDITTFAADYLAITGKAFPVVVPTPTPVPTPPAPPAPPESEIAKALEAVEKALVRAANEIAKIVKGMT